MNAPCTLCGSRYWPIKDASCPLCRAREDEEVEDEDHDEDSVPDSYDDRRYDDSENRMVNGTIHGARTHRHDL